MRRLGMLAVLAAMVAAAGGAAIWIERARTELRPSEFDCLATAHAGWLTISTDEVTVHTDWTDAAGHIDGVPGASGQAGEPSARALALDLTRPLKVKPSGTSRGAKVNMFAVCDGVEHWWSGTSPTHPTFKQCLQVPGAAAVAQCMREVFAWPTPPPASAQAYEVAKKVLQATGSDAEPHDPMPYFPLLHPRGPAVGDLED
ncbi:MAG: hypothetical protein QM723_21760 [Myxococcaceae bacterium]